MKELKDLADETLISLVADGDAIAFEEIDRRWRKLLTAFINGKLGGNIALADEIAQTVLVKAWERSGQYNVACGAFRSWIRRMAANAIVDYRRHNGRQKRGGGCQALEIVDDCIQGDEDVVIEESVDVDRLNELIETLPCKERKAIRAMLRDESAQTSASKSELTRAQMLRLRNLAIERMRDSICLTSDGSVTLRDGVEQCDRLVQQTLF